MEKLFTKISFQKTIAIIISFIILIALIFGIITRISYLSLSQNKDELSKAKIQLSKDWSEEYNYIYSNIDYNMALAELEQSQYIFYAKCIESEVCYNCIKYKIDVTKTIKGDVKETTKEIILYQFTFFDFSKQGVTFVSVDNSLPLKEGKEYLLFANKKDYYEEYQKTLDKNEYSLCLSGSFPTALIVNENQDEYINILQVKKYSDIENLYYMCFDESSLNNINKVSKQIVNHYLETELLCASEY